MDVQAIYALARQLAGNVDPSEAPDAKLLPFLNARYHQIENGIVSDVNEDFFYQEFVTDTVAGQREYTLPVKSGTTPGLKKLILLSVKYLSTDLDYARIDPTRIPNLEMAPDFYDDGHSRFYYIADNSVFIYPTPTESVTSGLKLYGVCNLGDLASNSTETAVKIPIEFHDILSYALRADIYRLRGLLNEASVSEADFREKYSEMVGRLSDRLTAPVVAEMPDTTYLS